MANSKLMKEAIADAKAVRETAIANARLALEEAFTPKLQSILSKKLQAEMEDDEYEDELELDELDASKVGTGDNVNPAKQSETELDPETQKQTSALGAEDDNNEKVDDLTEAEADEDDEDVTGATYDVNEEEDEELDIDIEDDEEESVVDDDEDEDELDLESIIRELEDEMDDEDFEDEVEDVTEAEHDDDDEELDIDIEDDEVDDIATDISDDEIDIEDEDDEEIDLDEILREMGLTDDDEDEEEEVEDETPELEERISALETDLSEAYGTIKSLKGTINEVNLLNAKLLFANKLFRSYNLSNEQKVKVVENLDRTNSVREVKLVYATLSESLKFGGTVTKKAKKMTEGFASKASKTTAPTTKTEIIQEGNELSNRFKELAGIINK